jgi:hypothetical protein
MKRAAKTSAQVAARAGAATRRWENEGGSTQTTRKELLHTEGKPMEGGTETATQATARTKREVLQWEDEGGAAVQRRT